jgi:hypothetical protein
MSTCYQKGYGPGFPFDIPLIPPRAQLTLLMSTLPTTEWFTYFHSST